MIAAIVWPLAEMQKAYGRQINAKLVMQGWQAMLADMFTGEQVCFALKQYALRGGDDFPTPKNLYEILYPAEPEVTDAEYVQACKHMEKQSFYDNYCNEALVIKRYRAQKESARHQVKNTQAEVLRLAAKKYVEIADGR